MRSRDATASNSSIPRAGRDLLPGLGYFAAAALVIAVAVFSAAPIHALAGLPLLLIVVALIAGWYPGAETLVRLAESRTRNRRARPRAQSSRRVPAVSFAAPMLRNLSASRRLRGPPPSALAASS
jgi:hypothetical protein